MRSTRIAGTLVLGIALLAACADRTNPTAVSGRPFFAGVPAGGNGSKLVISVDEFLPGFPTCEGGASLSLHVVGWIQIREARQAPGGTTFHLVFTYSNAAGETFVWHNIDSDHFRIDEDGNVIDAITGRSGVNGVIGRLVVNTATGEVEFVAGKEAFANDLACAALT